MDGMKDEATESLKDFSLLCLFSLSSRHSIESLSHKRLISSLLNVSLSENWPTAEEFASKWRQKAEDERLKDQTLLFLNYQQ